MEVDDRLASQIHGIISSDSDSDLEGKREFDEEYNSLKPPPYDYESIRDRIVVISQIKVANAWEKRLEITPNTEEVKIAATRNVSTPKKKKTKSKSKTEDQAIINNENGLIRTKNDCKKESPSGNTTEKETLDIFSVLSNNRNSGKKKITPLDIEFLDDYKEYVQHNSINISEEKCIKPRKGLEVDENSEADAIKSAFNSKLHRQNETHLQRTETFLNGTDGVRTRDTLKEKIPNLEDSEAWEIPKKQLKRLKRHSLNRTKFSHYWDDDCSDTDLDGGVIDYDWDNIARNRGDIDYDWGGIDPFEYFPDDGKENFEKNVPKIVEEKASNVSTPKQRENKPMSKTEDQAIINNEKGSIRTKNDNKNEPPSRNTTEKETLDILSNNRNSGKKKITPPDMKFLDSAKDYVEYNSINISEEKCIDLRKGLEVEENSEADAIKSAFNIKLHRQNETHFQPTKAFLNDTDSITTTDILKEKIPNLEDSKAWEIPKKQLKWLKRHSSNRTRINHYQDDDCSDTDLDRGVIDYDRGNIARNRGDIDYDWGGIGGNRGDVAHNWSDIALYWGDINNDDWEKNWNDIWNKNPKTATNIKERLVSNKLSNREANKFDPFEYFLDDGGKNVEKNVLKKAEEKASNVSTLKQQNKSMSNAEDRAVINNEKELIKTKNYNKKESPAKNIAEKETLDILSILSNNHLDIEFLGEYKGYVEHNSINISGKSCIKPWKALEGQENPEVIQSAFNSKLHRQNEKQFQPTTAFLNDMDSIRTRDNEICTDTHLKMSKKSTPPLKEQSLNLNSNSATKDFNKKKKKFRPLDVNILLNDGCIAEVEETTKTKNHKGKTTETTEVSETTRKLEYIDISEARIPALTVKTKKKKTKTSKKSVENSSNDAKDTTEEQEDRECNEILAEIATIVDNQENHNQTVLHEDITDNDIELSINISSANEDHNKMKKKFRPFDLDILLNHGSIVEVEKTTKTKKHKAKTTETTEMSEKTLKLEYIDISEASIPALTVKTKKKKTKKSKQSLENSSNDTKDTTEEQEDRECKEILAEIATIVDNQENSNQTVLHEEIIDNNIQPTINFSSTNEDLHKRKKKLQSFVNDTVLNDRSMVEVEKTTEGKNIKGKATETEVLEKIRKLEYIDISEASIPDLAVKTKKNKGKKKKSGNIGDNINETTEEQECEEVLGETVTIINNQENLNRTTLHEEIKEDIIDNTMQESINLSLDADITHIFQSEDVVEGSTTKNNTKRKKKSKNITMIELLKKMDEYDKKLKEEKFGNTDSLLRSILDDALNVKMPATPIAEAKTKKKRWKKSKMTVTEELPRSESVDIVDHNIILRTEESDQDTKRVMENYEKHFVEQSDNAQEIADYRDNISEAKITEVDNNFSIKTDSKTSLSKSGKKTIILCEKFRNFIHNPYSSSSNITLNLTIFNYEQLYRGLIIFIRKSNEKYHALIPSKIFLKNNLIRDYFVEHTYTEICSKINVDTKKDPRKSQKQFSGYGKLYEYDINTIEKKNRLFKQICMFVRQNFVLVSKIWEIHQNNNNSFFDKIIEAIRPKEKMSTSIRLDLATIFDNRELTLENFGSCATIVPKNLAKFNYEQHKEYMTLTFKKKNLCIDNQQINTIVPTNYLNKNHLINFEAKIDEISSISWQIDSRLYPNISIISNIIDALIQRRNNSRKNATCNIKNKDNMITIDLSDPSLNITQKETFQEHFPNLREANENNFTQKHKIQWLVRKDNPNKKKKRRFVPFSQYNPKLVEENCTKTNIKEAKDSVKIRDSRINSYRNIFNQKIEAVNTKIESWNLPIETNTTNCKNITVGSEKKSKQSTVHQPSTGLLDKMCQNVPLGCIKKTDALKVQTRKKSRDKVTIPEENREKIEVTKPKNAGKTSSSTDLSVDIATVYKENFKTPENFTKSYGDFKKFFNDSSAVLQDCKQISEVISEQIGDPRTCNENLTKDLEKMVRKLLKINSRATAVISNCEEMCGLIGEGIQKNESTHNNNNETISSEKCRRPRSQIGNLSVNPKSRAQLTVKESDFAFPSKQRFEKNQDDAHKVTNNIEKITFANMSNRRVVNKLPTFCGLSARRKNSKEFVEAQNHRLEDVTTLSLPSGTPHDKHLTYNLTQENVLLKIHANKCFENPIQRLAARKRRNGHGKTKKDDDIITLLAIILAVIFVQMFMEMSDPSPLKEFRNMSLFENISSIFVISLIFICYKYICM